MIDICFARLSSATLILLCSLTALADTTTVQTYTFEAQNNPATAYDSPGRRWFEFPASDNGVEYGKVIMEYTLKCFEDGTAGNLGYACGEWDYLSYTYLFDHTGLLDSTALQHPFRLLADAPFETADLVPYVDGVQDSVWLPAAQHVVDVVNSETVVQPGTVDYADDLFAPASSKRAQFLWTAEELAPLGAGAIDRLFIPVLAGAADARRLDLKWGLTGGHGPDRFLGFAQHGLSVRAVDLAIRRQPLASPSARHRVGRGEQSRPRIRPGRCRGGHRWPQDGWVAVGHAEGQGWTSADEGGEVHFTAPDRIAVDVADLGGLSDEITIECWVYGDPESQPQNGTLFEGLNANNQRVVNVHLPWGNGRVYWDCGWDGGYDRIDAQAATADYEGQWNHWAFVKNATTGVMEMYLNGVLFHSGTNKDNPIEGIVRMNLGCSGTGTNHYNGRVDDFRIWGKGPRRSDHRRVDEPPANRLPPGLGRPAGRLPFRWSQWHPRGQPQARRSPGSPPRHHAASGDAGPRAVQGRRDPVPPAHRLRSGRLPRGGGRRVHSRPAPCGADEPVDLGGAGQRGRHDRPDLPLRARARR